MANKIKSQLKIKCTHCEYALASLKSCFISARNFISVALLAPLYQTKDRFKRALY